jgi:phosphatidylserine/phosphatidylglycerophosphate/cardiolipin synthase-like enzyme
MPWHDVHMVCNGLAALDIARNFIQRWNYHKVVLQRFVVCVVVVVVRVVVYVLLITMVSDSQEDLGQTVPYLVPNYPYIRQSGTVSMRMVRSTSNWSSGMALREQSIHHAYCSLIEKAQHFVYIENQYFIGSLAGGITQNKVAETIATRIERAIKESQVCVCMRAEATLLLLLLL